MKKLVYKMNHTTGEHDLVPQDWELSLNIVTQRHEFADPNATLHLNPVDDTYALRTDDEARSRLNHMEGRHELAGDDWEVANDYVNDRHVFRPRDD